MSQTLLEMYVCHVCIDYGTTNHVLHTHSVNIHRTFIAHTTYYLTLDSSVWLEPTAEVSQRGAPLGRRVTAQTPTTLLQNNKDDYKER